MAGLFMMARLRAPQIKYVFKVDGHLFELATLVQIVYYRLSMTPPLKMYSKFVLPNWALFVILKWVRK